MRNSFLFSRHRLSFADYWPLVIFFSLLATSYWLLVTPVRAATLGFSTTKSLFDAEILPGTTYQDEMLLTNLSNDLPLPLHLQLSVWDLAEGSEEDIAFSDADDAGVDPRRWFSLVTSGGELPSDPVTLKPLATGHDLILGPKEEKLIRFRVRPPDDAPAGTYLVSMRFQAAVPEHYFESSGPRSIPEVATLFFMKIPFFSLDGKQTSYAAEIVEIGLKDEIQTTPGIIQVAQADILDDAAKVMAAKVKNTGMFYFKADGSLQIESWTGRTVKEIALPGKYMLPGKTRTIEIPLSVSEEGGLFKRIGQYIADNAYLGKYTATLILNYPDAGEGVGFATETFTQKSVSFWIFPWKFILIVAGIAGLITIFVKRFGGRIGRAFRIMFRGMNSKRSR